MSDTLNTTNVSNSVDKLNPPQTRFRIPFDTGNVDILFIESTINNREKAVLIGYIMRNIGLALTVKSKLGLFGVAYDYNAPEDLPKKLQILGRFESTAQVNDWEIKLENNWPKYTLDYKLRAANDNFKELFE